MSKLWVGGMVMAAVLAAAVWLVVAKPNPHAPQLELLNVSYDPTRELWREVNLRFMANYDQETGMAVRIKQSHGASSSQARAVLEGLEADVVTLALWPDVDVLRRHGLIDEGWEERLPNRALPYVSTVVFVVRQGNPKQIRDWPDLVRPGIQVITPNPKTSGNGKLSFLAAWAAVLHRGGTDAQALEMVRELYRHVPVLDTGARGAATTFAQRGLGDVLLTWENEAHLEVLQSKGSLQVVYPPVSIRAEPHVAVVDANARQKGTHSTATAYLRFLYTVEGQEILARHGYRPTNEVVLQRHAARFPPLELLPVTRVVPSWDEARQRFFAEGAIFDQILRSSAGTGR